MEQVKGKEHAIFPEDGSLEPLDDFASRLDEDDANDDEGDKNATETQRIVWFRCSEPR